MILNGPGNLVWFFINLSSLALSTQRALTAAEPMKTSVITSRLKPMTNLVLKVADSMSKLLKSSIGPSTRKDTSGPTVKVCVNADATNASEVEQRDRMKANPIMNR